jgi:hypothetical protein
VQGLQGPENSVLIHGVDLNGHTPIVGPTSAPQLSPGFGVTTEGCLSLVILKERAVFKTVHRRF